MGQVEAEKLRVDSNCGVDGRVGDAAGREKDFHAAPESVTDPYALETGRPPKAHRLLSDPASRLRSDAMSQHSPRLIAPCLGNSPWDHDAGKGQEKR